ncbi:potassium channel subfamily K member 4-like isoform X1 [Asterias rubens]|uniref:potassium channel subfamily K member 4-like isoform X1 n=1 Tax=Asterias rubens TaxID=7604 RepID=UPI00145515BE|nr:potassium channel subfamily K member 4-like isoform X1 [Asterias rubens]XP_033628393.1 potassium channel subfamily K member 4-like isoform X1 [Asterias rubens]XP_033628400.1 potassium channel subfamily K member 4-like isoform X1 [Asterias rubens]XP_033628406.1 potassium channel subfamily K member 4-like isoform X1 [Asterias rubens]
MDWKRLLILIAAFILYLVIGGLVFSALESTEQELTRVDVRSYKEKILNELPCLSGDQLEALITKIIVAVDSGLDPANNVTSKNSWDFSSAFFFSGTVVTTIGYGKQAPTTTDGRNFCIVYALFGIPFLGWLLAIIGDFYRETFCKMTNKIDCLLCDYCALKKRKLRRCIMWFVVASISYGILVLVPAAVFNQLEDWTFRIAHYYCFITLTTIGFGDYVASRGSTSDSEVLDAVYDIAIVFWYIFGLSFFAVVLSSIGTGQKKAANKIKQMKKHHHEKTIEHISESCPYTVDKETVQVTLEDGIIGPVTYHVHDTSLDANNSELGKDPLESPSFSLDVQPEIALSHQEYSFNNSNGNAFNSQSNLVTADELQVSEPCGLSDGPEEKKVPLRKKVSFDSNCNPNDGGPKRIRRKATGKRKSSKKSSNSKLKVNLEDEEDALQTGQNTVAMATDKTNCQCFCHVENAVVE